MLKNKKYFGLSLILSLLVLFLYPFLQVLPQGLNNFWFWFSFLMPLATLFYFLYGILFGVAVSFFIWRRQQKICPKFLGGLGVSVGGLASNCAACLSLAAFVLPISFVLFFAKYNAVMMGLSVILLFISLGFMGAFQKNNN